MDLGKENIEARMRPQIERIRESEIPQVVTIAQSLKLDTANPNPELQDKGFLVYVLDQEQYKRRINPYFYAAKVNNEMAGFFMNYDRVFLEGLIQQGAISHEDKILEFILSQQPDNIIFGDQIAITPEKQREGVGSALMEKLFADMAKSSVRNMYGAILHSPIKNEASIEFCTSVGAKNVGEVQNSDGLVWGIYRWTIQG